MKISLNSIRSINQLYGCATDIAPEGIDALVARIGSRLGGVDEINDVGTKYDKVVIVKIVDCQPHPDSDHMHVCRIDDAGITPDVIRGDDGFVQVVCGAPNVAAGMTVVWLPPGSVVPESYGKDPFTLGARELRGVMSNGMLASQRELALGESHDGILEITDDIAAGTLFADQYNLRGDAIIDIENKMFTHRPDAFGFLGIARELAGIQGIPFTSPDWYQLHPALPALDSEQLPLTIQNEIPELVPRFAAIVVNQVVVRASPLWLQVELSKYGLRSINNIVDYTNFFMMLTGQPLHAYDYDKLTHASGEVGPTIVIRHPRQNEHLKLLNGKSITPRPESIVIATDTQLIGLGGVMGGAQTEVDTNTTKIVLEVATFDMYSIRRTSMAHGLFTDAVTRFNKGQSPLQNLAVLTKIVDEICKFAGGKVASEVVDHTVLGGREWVHPPIPIGRSFINSRLGLTLTADAVKVLLENVEFVVSVTGDNLTVTAPFWRTDVETREDVIEEVGRLYGFDNLPLELPRRSIHPVTKDASLALKQDIRNALSLTGANEVLSYSFVPGDLIQKVGQDTQRAFQVSNALSPDLQYYRLSLMPSLLDKIHPNSKAGYDRFSLFEMGKAHILGSEMDGLPTEFERVALVYAASDKQAKRLQGAAFFEAKLIAETLLRHVGVAYTIDAIGDDDVMTEVDQITTAPFDDARMAIVRVGGMTAGFIGEYSAGTRRNLKLPAYSAGFELYLSELTSEQKPTYVALSKFPLVTQDITLKIPSSVSYGQLDSFMRQALHDQAPNGTTFAFEARDIYRSADDGDHTHVTFRLEIASYEKTMTDKEVSTLLGLVANSAHGALSAEQI